jgi:hypothetical protein
MCLFLCSHSALLFCRIFYTYPLPLTSSFDHMSEQQIFLLFINKMHVNLETISACKQV